MNRRQFSFSAVISAVAALFVKKVEAETTLPILKFENGVPSNTQELLGDSPFVDEHRWHRKVCRKVRSKRVYVLKKDAVTPHNGIEVTHIGVTQCYCVIGNKTIWGEVLLVEEHSYLTNGNYYYGWIESLPESKEIVINSCTWSRPFTA